MESDMTAEEDYIIRVVDRLPRDRALRSHVAMDLRSHIAERSERGQPIDEVLRQLGDPVALAESYLSAEPLRAGIVLGARRGQGAGPPAVSPRRRARPGFVLWRVMGHAVVFTIPLLVWVFPAYS